MSGMRYGVMYAQKSMEGRKVTVMDFKMARMITFTINEIPELDNDLQEFMQQHLKKLESGYWDYTGKYRKGNAGN
jgi:hypothetical protein